VLVAREELLRCHTAHILIHSQPLCNGYSVPVVMMQARIVETSATNVDRVPMTRQYSRLMLSDGEKTVVE
jgi:hypothetical protein